MTPSDSEKDALATAEDEPVTETVSEPVDGEETGEEEEKQPLNLEVSVDEPSACERHVTVTIAREDVDRYLSKAYDELMTDAQVPGFRPGRAPRKLVESRFRKDVTEKVKGELVMESIDEVNDRCEFSPISEPDFKFDAITVPDEGPMTYEFDIEVRPTFELPQWKGLKIKRPVRDFTEADIDAHIDRVRQRLGKLVDHDGPAAAGDHVTLNMTFKREGRVVSELKGASLHVMPRLSFADATLEGFDKVIEGASPGDKRETTVKLSDDAENEEFRGAEVNAVFEVTEVQRADLPEIDAEFLKEIGPFDDVEHLRETVRHEMDRQLAYYQQREVREQITASLIESANWELPPDLLKRQSRRELERAVMELRRSGFDDDEIQQHLNEIRQNSKQSTERALKEHFILERIAEQEEVEVDDEDYEDEIELIAAQQGDSPRRVRARIEKHDQMDVLRNQIIERKVIELITEEAEFTESAYQPKPTDVEAVDFAIGGIVETAIPEAHNPDVAKPLSQPAERD